MEQFLELFVTSSLFIFIIIFIRAVFQKKLNVHLQYALWLLVAMKLLLFPIPQIPSVLSVKSMLSISGLLPKDTGQDRENQLQTDAVRQDGSVGITLQPHDSASKRTDNRSASDFYGQARNNIQTDSQKLGISRSKDTPAAAGQRKRNLQKTGDIWQFWTVLSVVGSIVMFLYFAIGNLRFARYLYKNRIYQIQNEFPLPVYLVDGLPSPCLYGRAVYLTGEQAADSVRMRHILMHEYCHYRQGDLAWSVLRCLCVICYWWHPFVWLAAALSKQDCELSCDQAALRRLGEEERILYGRTLLSLLMVTDKPKDTFSIAAFMKGETQLMKRRIQRIARQNKTARSVGVFTIIFSMICFLSVITSAPTAKSSVQNADSFPASDNSCKPDRVQEGPQKPKITNKQRVLEKEDVFDLEKAVADMLMSDNKKRYAPGECAAQGHMILGSKQRKDGSMKVYVLTMYGEYAFQNGSFIKVSGSGVIPAVMIFDCDSNLGYLPKACKYPMDGSGYLTSIAKMFPKKLYDRCANIRRADEKALIRQERAYAKKYLKEIGRKAKIGDYGDSEHPLLTDAGVSVEVSNKLCGGGKTFLANYPDWIGDLERIEQGVRYRYALALNKKQKEIIYTKCVYETGDIAEDIRFDMDTGKLISHKTYPKPETG